MNQRHGNTSRLTNFLRRNGVYLALVVSLLAVGAVVIAGFTRQLTKEDTKKPQNAQQQVEQIVTGQKDTRTTTTTTTMTTTTVTTTATEEEAPYLYLLPLTNTVQKPYSAEAPIYCETMKDWRLHLGADFAGEEGQTVKAVTTVVDSLSDLTLTQEECTNIAKDFNAAVIAWKSPDDETCVDCIPE